MTKIVRQTTLDPEQGVDKFTVKTKAPTRLAAKQRARQYMRRQVPTAKNVFTPRVSSREEAEQSNLRDFFPKTWHSEEFMVEITVVR